MREVLLEFLWTAFDGAAWGFGIFLSELILSKLVRIRVLFSDPEPEEEEEGDDDDQPE